MASERDAEFNPISKKNEWLTRLIYGHRFKKNTE